MLLEAQCRLFSSQGRKYLVTCHPVTFLKEFPPRECLFTQNYSPGPEVEVFEAFW